MNFNLKHYANVWRMHPKKEEYCFPLRMFLSKNGLYENHKLKGKIFTKNGEDFLVDDVYVHWWEGWYYVASMRNSKNSHYQMTWNINSKLTDFNLHLFKLKR